MKKQHLGTTILLGMTILLPGVPATPAAAQVSIQVGIALPPPIVFAAPPQVVVLPGFDIYVAPDIAEEVYFVDGFWWRPWQGHWYRSHSYDNGWNSYEGVPSFYRNVRHDWRGDYQNHRWEGQAWNYERMPYQRVEQNWSSWKSNNYWQSQHNWGVPEMKGRQQAREQRTVSPASQHRDSATRSPGTQYQGAPPKAAHSQHRAAPAKAEHSEHRAAPQHQQRASHPQAQHAQHSKGNSESHGQNPGHGGDQGDAQPAAQHGGGKGKH